MVVTRHSGLDAPNETGPATGGSLRSAPRATRRAITAAAILLVAASLVATAPAVAQAFEEPEQSEARHRFGVEAKAHYRDTDEARFLNPFRFPLSFLPEGETRGFLEAVEPGQHTDMGVVTLWYKGLWAEVAGGGIATKVKVDLIDLHDRNPTSTDDEWDVDELWVRWGRETEPGMPHDGVSLYGKLGKFPKFERQDDRHLESYGLLGTAFNRMEDIGVELGLDYSRVFYMKASFTEGNPLFLRDPNALAGDNGIPLLLTPNPDPELKGGIVIPYDADLSIDEAEFDDPETGLGLGMRFGDDAGTWNVDVLAFTYRRDLADTRSFEGSFYGGDLDLLLGPLNAFPFAVTDRTKQEVGLSFWIYAGDLSIFGQYVDQDVAGLGRDGFEVEVAYDFELPWIGTLFGRQLFPYIAPAVRYSELDPNFPLAPPDFLPHPSPSFNWDWRKLDVGIRLGLLTGLDLTLEYADNEFVRAGRDESADEMLATLRFNWDWSSGI